MKGTRGRPVGTKKPYGIRKQRQLRAYDDEWEIILRFAKALKWGRRGECEAMLEQMERRN